VSALVVIAIVLVVLLLVAMLIGGGRKAAAARAHRDLGEPDDSVHPFRSHAEASRRSDRDDS
jgi:cbb3-type cytochrome oxidase subunit 3